MKRYQVVRGMVAVGEQIYVKGEVFPRNSEPEVDPAEVAGMVRRGTVIELIDAKPEGEPQDKGAEVPAGTAGAAGGESGQEGEGVSQGSGEIVAPGAAGEVPDEPLDLDAIIRAAGTAGAAEPPEVAKPAGAAKVRKGTS